MARHVLAVDPGKMTGVAYLDRETNDFKSYELDFDATCAFAEKMSVALGTDLLIVSESFIITVQTAKNTQAPWSLELIGVLRFLSRRFTEQDIVLQSPSTAKRFSSDERLKQMGWHVPGKGHANDAARHLLLVCATRGWLPDETLRLLATPAQ